MSPAGVTLTPEIADAFDRMRSDRAFCAAVMTGTIKGVDPDSEFFRGIVDDAFGVEPAIWRAVPDLISRPSLIGQLASISHRVLIAHGSDDPVLPPADSRALALSLPNARYLELAARGHSPNVEDADGFAAMLDEFRRLTGHPADPVLSLNISTLRSGLLASSIDCSHVSGFVAFFRPDIAALPEMRGKSQMCPTQDRQGPGSDRQRISFRKSRKRPRKCDRRRVARYLECLQPESKSQSSAARALG